MLFIQFTGILLNIVTLPNTVILMTNRFLGVNISEFICISSIIYLVATCKQKSDRFQINYASTNPMVTIESRRPAESSEHYSK
jgi:hypothetical protein